MAPRAKLAEKPSHDDWVRILKETSKEGNYRDWLVYQVGQDVFAAVDERAIPPEGIQLSKREILLNAQQPFSPIGSVATDILAPQAPGAPGEIIFESDEPAHSLPFSPTYIEEVKKNLDLDLVALKERFNFENSKKIHIKAASKETHYGGKVPLFLTIETKEGKQVKLVYKPRSVLPEIILEDCRSQLSKFHPRILLDFSDHGYDTFINGDRIEIPPRKEFLFAQELIKHGNAKKENLCLLYAIHRLGIEDTHPENFIIDREGILHFVDAEVYLTNISVGLDDLFAEKKPDSDEELLQAPVPTLKLDATVEKQLESISQRLKEQLSRHPTRLVFCSTRFYAYQYTPDRPKFVRFAEGRVLKKLESFEDYHTAQIAKFLYVRKKINFDDTTDLTIEMVRKKIASVFEEGGLDKINNELKAVQRLGKTQNLPELPLFKFHLVEEWIECPLTEVRINFVKKAQVGGDEL